MTFKLPEPAKCEGGWEDPCVYYYTADQLRQAYEQGRAEVEALSAELESVRADAERYRWFIEPENDFPYRLKMSSKDDVDAFVDAARKAT